MENEKFIEEPSALQQLVAELKHEGRSNTIGIQLAVSTRLDPPAFGMVAALTEMAGTSRNKLMNQLVEIGIESVLQQLSPDAVENLYNRAGHFVKAAIKEDAAQ